MAAVGRPCSPRLADGSPGPCDRTACSGSGPGSRGHLGHDTGDDSRLRDVRADPSHRRVRRQPDPAVLLSCGPLGWDTRLGSAARRRGRRGDLRRACRTEPSVLRAAAMGLVALAASAPGDVAPACATSASPDDLDHDRPVPGWFGWASPLSVLASAGIIGWAAGWTAAASVDAASSRHALAVPLAAHLATLPVVAAISGHVSVVGVLATPSRAAGAASHGARFPRRRPFAAERHLGRMRRFRSGLVGAGDHLDRVAGRSAAGRILALAGVAPGADVARRFLAAAGVGMRSCAPPRLACCCTGLGADRRPAGGSGAARLAAPPTGSWSSATSGRVGSWSVSVAERLS